MPSASDRTVTASFRANPKQQAFIESRAEADLFASRMGEGKSAALTWSAAYHTKKNPGAVWAFIRDTWENMRATTLREFFYWFNPGVHGHWVAGEKKWVWADGFASGEVHFLGLDDPNDAGKLQSRVLAGVAFDEVAGAAAGSGGIDELIFDIALGRLRQPGMNWYAAKLAENNPDETHWTYRRFIDPGQAEATIDPSLLPPWQEAGFRVFHPTAPENEKNLPPGYYEKLRRMWGHREDLVSRFVEGKYGFQQVGQAVTPQWSDDLHLVSGLAPVRGTPLTILWDFGHNPTAIITQRTPLGYWLVLDAMVGDGIGVEELVAEQVKPLLASERYGRKFTWRHTGDPQGKQREQTSIYRSAVKVLTTELGGGWVPGPVKIAERVEPLRAVLRRQITGGRGVVQVDRQRASAVWQALRGGWRYHVARSGVLSKDPVKDMHSHPGDAMGYGAALLFPVGKLDRGAPMGKRPVVATYGPAVSLPTGTGITGPRAPARVLRQMAAAGTLGRSIGDGGVG